MTTLTGSVAHSPLFHWQVWYVGFNMTQLSEWAIWYHPKCWQILTTDEKYIEIWLPKHQLPLVKLAWKTRIIVYSMDHTIVEVGPHCLNFTWICMGSLSFLPANGNFRGKRARNACPEGQKTWRDPLNQRCTKKAGTVVPSIRHGQSYHTISVHCRESYLRHPKTFNELHRELAWGVPAFRVLLDACSRSNVVLTPALQGLSWCFWMFIRNKSSQKCTKIRTMAAFPDLERELHHPFITSIKFDVTYPRKSTKEWLTSIEFPWLLNQSPLCHPQ